MRFVILILVAAIVSAIGFHKYVWFISLGYGFSITALGIALFVMFPGVTDPLDVLFRVLLIAYGLRLGGYLAYREVKSASYNKLMQKEIKGNSQVSLGARIAIWVSVAILYPLMVAPVYFRLANGAAPNVWGWVGLIVQAAGILASSSTGRVSSSRASARWPAACSGPAPSSAGSRSSTSCSAVRGGWRCVRTATTAGTPSTATIARRSPSSCPASPSTA